MQQVTEVTKHIERLLEQIERTTGQKPVSEARRDSLRYIWLAPATVILVDSQSPSEPLLVTLGHISRDGLEFRSSRRIKVDQKVLVGVYTDEGELQIPATVVHSTESGVRFIVGVKFDS